MRQISTYYDAFSHAQTNEQTSHPAPLALEPFHAFWVSDPAEMSPQPQQPGQHPHLSLLFPPQVQDNACRICPPTISTLIPYHSSMGQQ